MPLRLSDMVELWWKLHGQYLGKRSVEVKERLNRIVNGLCDPFAHELTSEHFSEYRANRLNGSIAFKNLKKTISLSTANMELRILKAMINELIKLKKWKWENPLMEMGKPFTRIERI